MMKKFGDKATYKNELADEKSKSQVKRELLALKELGKELLKLPVKDIAKLDLSERLYEALLKAHGMTRGALKRQVATIGSLMADEDHNEIKLRLGKIRRQHNGEVKQFRQLEQWRDQLLAGDADVMSILRNQFDDFDMQYVRQLVRNAIKETGQEKPPKSVRVLFKYLQQLNS